jgi:hypothetical protein
MMTTTRRSSVDINQGKYEVCYGWMEVMEDINNRCLGSVSVSDGCQ